ncbi:DUF6069 family protein [Kitasatospora sp. NPDC088346]|uniref:DUF6069 family protein n=1 Tax=Kitasatospora sp. NPDC088346 TaxID=3364073 RepID=UPI003823D3C4
MNGAASLDRRAAPTGTVRPAAGRLPALVGWGSPELLEHLLPRRATAIWTGLAILVLVAGLPYDGTGVTTTDQFLPAGMHLIAGAAVIPAFVITSRRRRS